MPGYIAAFGGKNWFYLPSKQLRQIIGTGLQAKALKQTLVAEGLLAAGSMGRHLVQRPIFADLEGNKGHKWVHAIRMRILGAAPDNE
ncbi:MAG: hypothetical protein ACJ72H_15400 [Candidatus Sulfotelmatobacter sp.]